MAKNDAKTNETSTAYVAPDSATLVIGDLIYVTVAPGVILRNNDTGAPFVAGEATAVHVTDTTLRRLADGDLQQVAAPAV